MASHGGMPNGQTLMDHTRVWETLPSNQLELALFLEADRMRSLRLDQATAETGDELALAREVVVAAHRHTHGVADFDLRVRWRAHRDQANPGLDHHIGVGSRGLHQRDLADPGGALLAAICFVPEGALYAQTSSGPAYPVKPIR